MLYSLYVITDSVAVAMPPDERERTLHNLRAFSIAFWCLELIACALVVALRPHYDLLGVGVAYYLLEITGTLVGLVYTTYQAYKVSQIPINFLSSLTQICFLFESVATQCDRSIWSRL